MTLWRLVCSLTQRFQLAHCVYLYLASYRANVLAVVSDGVLSSLTGDLLQQNDRCTKNQSRIVSDQVSRARLQTRSRKNNRLIRKLESQREERVTEQVTNSERELFTGLSPPPTPPPHFLLARSRLFTVSLPRRSSVRFLCSRTGRLRCRDKKHSDFVDVASSSSSSSP